MWRHAPVSLVSLLALLGGGCASVYTVKIDAAARGAELAKGRTSYRIEDRSAVADGRVLRRKEISGFLKTALSAHGLYEAPEPTAAEVVVELRYGIAPARERRFVYQELVNGRPVSPSERVGPPPEGVAREMVGYAAMATTTVLREKFLSISARENGATESAQPPRDLWSVQVSIDDEDDDLRGHLPVLISAAMDRIGQSTDGTVTVTLCSDDEAVRFVRRGL